MHTGAATKASAASKKTKVTNGKNAKVDSASPEAGGDDEESNAVKDEPAAEDGGLDDVFD